MIRESRMLKPRLVFQPRRYANAKPRLMLKARLIMLMLQPRLMLHLA